MPVVNGRLTCCTCGADLGDAEDPYRDPDCRACLRRECEQYEQEAKDEGQDDPDSLNYRGTEPFAGCHACGAPDDCYCPEERRDWFTRPVRWTVNQDAYRADWWDGVRRQIARDWLAVPPAVVALAARVGTPVLEVIEDAHHASDTLIWCENTGGWGNGPRPMLWEEIRA